MVSSTPTSHKLGISVQEKEKIRQGVFAKWGPLLLTLLVQMSLCAWQCSILSFYRVVTYALLPEEVQEENL